MKILIQYKPSVIRLKGDKETEAVANYMYHKHNIDIFEAFGDVNEMRSFVCNFLIKYHANARLVAHKGIPFYYVHFGN